MSQVNDVRKVELVEHDPRWSEMAEELGREFSQIVGANCLVVHHIGSTSIEFIKAKPVIDLLPEVADLGALDAAKDIIVAAGYEWRGEFGLARRRFCTLSNSQTGARIANIHCYQSGDEELIRHLAFRDYLRAHSHVAREYEAEKVRCAELHRDDVGAYCDAKDAWIKRVERDAVEWSNMRPRA